MPKTNKKHMLKNLKINEVSLVGAGANPNAHVSIFKSLSKDDVAKQMFTDALYSIEMQQKLYETMDKVWDKNSALSSAIRTIIESDELDKKALAIQAVTDHMKSMIETINDSEVIKMIEKALDNKADTADPKPLIKENEMDKMKLFKALAVMTDVSKGIFNSWKKADQEAFIEKSDEDQAAALAEAVEKAEEVEKAKIAKTDETFEMDGNTIHKSEVGPGVFAMLKSQAAKTQEAVVKAEASEKLAKEEQDKRIAKELETEAVALFPNLPGTAVEKGAMLKSIRSLPQDQQDYQISVLKAGNDNTENLFKENGGNGAVSKTASEKLESLAKEHATANDVTFAKAYDAVLETKEGKDLYAAIV